MTTFQITASLDGFQVDSDGDFYDTMIDACRAIEWHCELEGIAEYVILSPYGHKLTVEA